MIGNNIKKQRMKLGMTQDQMAEALHVTRQTISNWERGRNEPDLEMIKKIAVYLEIEVYELMYEATTAAKKTNIVKRIETGISFGSCLAMILSFTTWKSIPWAIFHGICSWGYVIYYWLRY